MRIAMWTLVGLLPVLGGCDRGGDSSVPPPETGVPTDIDGTWAITTVDRVDGSGEPLPEPGLGASEFLPVAAGNRFEFVDGAAIDAQGMPLYGGEAPVLYINETGASWWRFEVRHESSSPLFVLDVRAFVMATDEDTLEGTVEVGMLGGGNQVNTVMPDPSGSFRIKIERVAEQTDGR